MTGAGGEALVTKCVEEIKKQLTFTTPVLTTPVQPPSPPCMSERTLVNHYPHHYPHTPDINLNHEGLRSESCTPSEVNYGECSPVVEPLAVNYGECSPEALNPPDLFIQSIQSAETLQRMNSAANSPEVYDCGGGGNDVLIFLGK